MAKKFLELEEAAKMLGITADALNEMRSRHELTAYRDGSSWKFKADEIERLAAQRQETADHATGEFQEVDEGVDSILLSEVELGKSPASTSSTVIGKTYTPPSDDDDIQVAAPQPTSKDDAGVSDVRLASDSDLVVGGSGLSSKFDDLDTLDLDLPAADESALTMAGPSSKASSSDISLPADTAADSGVDLDDAIDPIDALGGGTSSIELAGADDDDLVLGGSSGPGSDVTRSAGDSGISLVDPSDSGLSLEGPPLELGGSSVESLELGGEDMVTLEEEGDPDAATMLKSDDEFLLTPFEEGADDADSGSQVIALDTDSGEFDSGLGDASAGMMLEEDMGAGYGGAAAPSRAAAATAMAPATVAVAQAEVPFSTANVLALAACVLFLLLTGMMMFDILRNMWSWNAPYRVNSPIMDAILRMFG